MRTIITTEMHIPGLNRNRTVRILLPLDYEQNTDKHYPVMYMHDGQNLFEARTASFGYHWHIGEVLEELETREDFGGMIVVGVDSYPDRYERLVEYSPWENTEISKQLSDCPYEALGGKGEVYGQFMVHTLKPYIDENYRTLPNRDHTYMAGSSMGGLISLYIGYQYPGVYSAIGAFSNAIWFAKPQLFAHIAKNFNKAQMAVYLDIGTGETSDSSKSDFPSIYVQDTIELKELLSQLGQPEDQLQMVLEEGAIHNEEAWHRRFPLFMEFLRTTKGI